LADYDFLFPNLCCIPSSKIQKIFALLKYLYFIIAAIEIIAEAIPSPNLRFFTKSLLMPLLIATYSQSLSGQWNRFHRLIVAALVFSWFGDLALLWVPGNETDRLLMRTHKDANYFLVGLASFLIAHLLYCLAFIRVNDATAPMLLKSKPVYFAPLLIYMLVLLGLLLPAMLASPLNKPFIAPVIIYAIAIGMMVLFALNRYRRVNDMSFVLVATGACLFTLSDSIIAVNKFLYPFALSGVLIMLLYAAGQYFIAWGCLAQFNKEG